MITGKELADLKAVMIDAVKFSLEEVAQFNERIKESQDSGEVVTFAPRQIQLIRGALMCFMFRDELVRMAEKELSSVSPDAELAVLLGRLLNAVYPTHTYWADHHTQLVDDLKMAGFPLPPYS